MILLDWPDEETVGVQDQQKLWDEDWDDDDVEDNFAQQLKYVLFFLLVLFEEHAAYTEVLNTDNYTNNSIL